MIVAVPTWNDRVAPVFDVAQSVRLLEFEAGGLVRQVDGELPGAQASAKVAALVTRGVSLLICGAITRETECLARARGIDVVPFVAGGVGEVVDAWVRGTLAGSELRMPGCRSGSVATRAGGRRRPRRSPRSGRGGY